MATGGYNIGEAFVQVTPSFDQVANKIDRYFRKLDDIELPVTINEKHLNTALRNAAKKLSAVAIKVTPELDRSGVARLARDLNKLPTAARKVTVGVTLDDSGVRQGLDRISRRRPEITAGVSLDDSAVRAGLDRISRQRPRITAGVTLDDSQVRAGLNRISAQRLQIAAGIRLDDSAVRAKLNALSAAGFTIPATVDLHTLRAESQMDALARGRTVTINVEADTAAARLGLLDIWRQSRQINNSKIRATVDASSASRGIGIFGLLGSAIAGVGFAAPAAAAAVASIGVASVGVVGVVGTLFAAFNGIGDAVGAMQDADDQALANATSNAKQRVSQANAVADAQRSVAQAVTQADRQAVQSAQQVADARRQLQDAYRGVADAQRDAARGVADAERSLATAQRSALDAQQQLNRAREDAREAIEDLKLSLRGAALDEEAAVIALQRAQQRLAEARASGAQGLDMREAVLGVRQAALAVDEARERHVDLQQESARSARVGVEGSEQVVAAQQRVNDANSRVRQAEASLTQARRDGARKVADAQARVAESQRGLSRAQQQAAWAQQDAARQVADAQRRVTRAMQNTGSVGAAAMDKVNAAMDKLSPAGQRFAKFINNEMLPGLRDIGHAVQEATLPKFQRSLENLSALGPTLTTVLSGIGSKLGDVAIGFSEMISTPQWQADLTSLGKTTEEVLGSLGSAGQSISQAFMDIMIAASPVLVKIAEGLAGWAAEWADVISGMRSSGELADYFSDAWDVLVRVWDVLTNVIGAIWDFAVALAPLGDVVLTVVSALADMIRWVSELPSWLLNLSFGALLVFAAWTKLGGAIDGVSGAVARASAGWGRVGARLGRVHDTATLAATRFAALQSSTMGAAQANDHLARRLPVVSQGYVNTEQSARRFGTATSAAATRAQGALARTVGSTAAVSRGFGTVGPAATRAFSTAATTARSNMSSVANSVTPVVSRWTSGMGQIGASSRTAGQQVRTGLTTPLVGVGQQVTPLVSRWQTGMGQLSGAARSTGAAIRSGLSAPVAAVTGAITPLVSRWQTGAAQIGTAARTAGTTIRTSLSGSLTSLTGGLRGAVATWQSGMSQIGGAARGAATTIRTGLGRAVSGLTGALGGPWGLAITGAMVGLGFLVSKMGEADQQTEEYRQEISDLTDAFRRSNGVIDESIIAAQQKVLADKGVRDGARQAGLDFQQYTAALSGNKQALDQVAQGSDQAIRKLLSSAGASDQVVNAYTGLNRSYLTSSQSVAQLNSKFNESEAGMRAALFTSENLTDEQQRQLGAIRNASGALGEQVRKMKEAQDQYVAAEAALAGVSQETVRLWIEQDKLHEQNKSLADSTLSLESAQLRVEDARARASEALGKHGKNSNEYKQAAIDEAQAVLASADAAEQAAMDKAVNASETKKNQLGAQAYREEIARLVMQHDGPLHKTIRRTINNWSVADAHAAGLKIGVDDLGRAVAELPDGRTIRLNANAQNARNTVKATVTYMNGQSGTVTLWANRDPATGQVTWWKQKADGTWGRASLDARIDPATGKRWVWVKQSNGTWARSNLNADIDPATGKVRAWWEDANGKRATAILDLDTSPAKRAVRDYNNWIDSFFKNNKPKVPMPLPTTGSGMPWLGMYNNYATGGVAAKKLTPMAAGVAQVVPPNTWRVVGDRARGDEAFIPLDSAPRSHAILDVAAHRMGYTLTPMADGGLLAFQTGGLATPGPAGAAPPQPQSVPMAMDPAQVRAMQQAVDALNGSLVILNATLAVTTTAVQVLNTALTVVTASLHTVRTALNLFTAAAMRAATAGANVLQTRLLSGLRPALQAVSAEITSRTVPVLRTLQRHYSVHTVASIDTLRTNLGHLRNGFSHTSSQVSAHWSAMSTATTNNVSTMGASLRGLREGLRHVRNAFRWTSDWVNTYWAKIRGYTREPVVDAIEGPFNKGLIASWNALDRRFKLNSHIKPLAIKFATGGPVHGTGSRDNVPAYLMPGEYVWSKEAIKNVGGLENVDRLHQLARAGSLGPDARLGDATDAHKRQRLMRAVPIDDLPGYYAYGGVQPHVARAGKEIEKVFGAMPGGIGGVGQRANASDHPSGHALDFMTMANRRLGDRVATHLIQNSRRMMVKYLIWKQKINEGSGWDQMEDRGSITANHFDHVHASFLRAGQEGKLFGGALFDPQQIVNQHFRKAERVINDYLAAYKGNHHGQIAGGEAKYALGDVKKAAVEKLNESMMMTGGVGTGVQRWRPVVMQALRMLGLPASWAGLTLRRMHQESGGNPRAINDWDSNAAAGTPSKGLMQVIDPTFQSYRDHRLPNNVWAPLANIVASMRYAMSRYGSLPAAYNRPGGYDTGGWLPPGVTTTVNHTGKPEAVLTWQQWRDIHNLATAGGNGPSRSVQVYARTDADPTHIAHTVDRHLSIGARL